MNAGIIDVLIIAVIGVITWCVAAEGAFGAGTVLLCVIMSGLVAMNFFEPLARMLESISVIGPKADMIAMLLLFAGGVTLLRLGIDRICPTYRHMQGTVQEVGRWGCAGITGYITAGFVLTALHTSPLPRTFLGFEPARRNLLDIAAPDRQWLGFTQYVTEFPFSKTQVITDARVGVVEFPRVFDGRTAYHWYLHRSGAQRVLNQAGVSTAEPNDPRVAIAATEIVMPSFIVRYADRRSQLNGEAPAVETAPAEATAVPTGPNF